MNTSFSTINLSAVLATAVAAYAAVGFDNAAITAADAPVKGIAMNPGEAGDAIAVLAGGTVQVKGTGVITAGDKLVSSATGGVEKAGADPVNAFAVALTSAADGDLVEILIR